MSSLRGRRAGTPRGHREVTGARMKKLPTVRRRAVSLSAESIVRIDYEPPGGLPLVVEAAIKGVSLRDWALNNRELLETQLLKYGAVLFRGFTLSTAEDFEQTVSALAGEVMQYRERSSPRTEVGRNIYTSTDYPAEHSIFPHNEHSYSLTFPLKLFFFCLSPPARGGETPLVDTRRVYRNISPETRERFLEKGWMYVRNFNDGFGLSWQTVFQTEDRAEVERYCRSKAIEVEWKPDNRLRTRQVRPVTARHPRTGEVVWFNHATFFHVSTLEPPVREALLAEYRDEELPNNTYYGDGSPIEPAVMDELRAAYLKDTVSFPWREGDVVMLDNMLTAHARAPFEGPRKILFAMADPFSRTDFAHPKE